MAVFLSRSGLRPIFDMPMLCKPFSVLCCPVGVSPPPGLAFHLVVVEIQVPGSAGVSPARKFF